jgi:hypothetical protein
MIHCGQHVKLGLRYVTQIWAEYIRPIVVSGMTVKI